MERIDDCDSLQVLRRANDRFTRFFARFSGAPVLGTDEEAEALLQLETTLKSVRPYLDGRLQGGQTTLVHDELGRYRANLLRLRQELAVMQNAAIGCPARLSARNKQVQAAQAWRAASRAPTLGRDPPCIWPFSDNLF